MNSTHTGVAPEPFTGDEILKRTEPVAVPTIMFVSVEDDRDFIVMDGEMPEDASEICQFFGGFMFPFDLIKKFDPSDVRGGGPTYKLVWHVREQMTWGEAYFMLTDDGQEIWLKNRKYERFNMDKHYGNRRKCTCRAERP